MSEKKKDVIPKIEENSASSAGGETSVSKSEEEPNVLFSGTMDELVKRFGTVFFDDTDSEYSSSDSDGEVDFEEKDFIEMMRKGRVRYIVSPRKCFHQRNYIKCACMHVHKVDKKNFYFDETLVNDLSAINMELRLREFTKSDSFDAGDFHYRHIVTILALTTKDKNLVCLPEVPRGKFLSMLYELREHYGRIEDFGQKNEISNEEYHAEGVSELLKSAFSIVSDVTVKTFDKVSEIIKCVFSKIMEFLQSVFGMISESFAKITESLFVRLRRLILKCFDPVKFIRENMADTAYSSLCIVVCMVAVFCVIEIIGILSFSIVGKLIDKLIQYFSQETYEAQAPSDPVGGLITLTAVILGLTKFEFSIIAKRAREFTSLVAAGLGGSWMLSSLFLVLPITIQTALTMKFSTEKEKQKMVIDEWLLRATAVTRLKKIPKVLVSPEYFKWVAELVSDAQGLRVKIKEPSVCNIFVRMLISLMEILAMLENYNREKSYRDYPYSLHVVAPPGFGKTLISSKMIRDLFDVQEREVYTRPVSDDYWSGFIDQRVIFYDEFLIGSAEQKEKHALEYLEIVSTKCYKPNMPSVDDPAVGIKGTRCEPIAVLSMNNNAYTRVNGIPHSALWRRRKFVINITVDPRFAHLMNGHNFDLKRLTEHQLRNIEWLVFDLLPNEPNIGQPINGLSYNDMITLLRRDINEHKIMCDRIRSGFHDAEAIELSPNQLLEDALRELRGIPNEPKNLTDTIFDLFVDTKQNFSDLFSFSATAEGPEGSPETQGMDVSGPGEQSKRTKKPTVGTEELKIWNFVRNFMTKKKSRESIIRRLEKAVELCRELPLSQDLIVLGDRKVLFAMINDMCSKFDMIVPEFIDVEEEYESCEDDINFEPQKNILSDIAHSNVDPAKIHRHRCMGQKRVNVFDSKGQQVMDGFGRPVTKVIVCTSHFAHRHEPNVHGFLCPTCKKDGARQSYMPVHGGPYANYDDNLLPEVYDSVYIGEPEGYKERMEKLWLDVILDKYVSYGTTPIVMYDATENFEDFGLSGGIYCETNTAEGMFRSSMRFTAMWVGFFVLVRGVTALFKNTKEKEVCFGAESPRPNRETTKGRPHRNYTKAYAQSGNLLTFEIDGKVMNAIPIRGRTFMTYYHAFLDVTGQLIEEGTEIIIKWLGVSDRVFFNSSMTRSCVDDDILFFSFNSKKISAFPDITKKFWTNEDVENFNSTSAVVELAGNPRYITAAKGKNKNYSYLMRKFEMPECLMYRYPTEKGDCGSPIISVGQLCPGKIMGMHVAGGKKDNEKFGLGVIVTKEDILEALADKEFDTDVDFKAEGPEIREVIQGDNLRKITEVPISEQVHISRVSKIRRSKISDDLPWYPRKYLPILSSSDPRSNGFDPMIRAVQVAVDVTHDASRLDTKLLHECAEATLKNYENKMKWPLGKRRLTFEEALQGIPGKLASLKVSTSPGYPLCKVTRRPGKQEFFRFGANGDLWYDSNFRQMVEMYVEKMETEGIKERRFVAYLKDELVSQSKIKRIKTRIIYSGDLISNVAYRMVFGSVLAAINASYMETPSAVGMNQFSHDMHDIYDYLSEVGTKNFVAGDIDEWDKHQLSVVLLEGYWVFSKLAGELTTKMGMESFIEQQCYSPAQVMDMLVYFVITYFSGLFLTTIMNNITHEISIRYIFARNNSNLVFEDHARVKLGGDDHIYNFSDEAAPEMTPFKIRDRFKELGHTYTSDIKDEDLKDEFRTFEDITFLGAHPVLVNGKYCGALKKATIEETLHWTRNRNKTLIDECRNALEMASVWGREYYEYLCYHVNAALLNNFEDKLIMPDHSEMVRIVAGRTASSNAGFPNGFFAQGPPVNSLAKLNEHKVVDGKRLNDPQKDSLSGKAVNEGAMNVDFGTESRVFRGQFDWSTSDVPGVPIFSVDVPFGVLSLGDADNVQNMGFDRFVYWKGDVEVSFQINGTPFQQGLLVAYFVPLASYPVELANITTCSHVKIQPDQSSTYTLRIPYLYLRSVMNTIARSTESLGTIHVTPLSSLLSNTDVDTVTLTMYSAYPDSKFTIPRPLMSEPGRNKFYKVDGDNRVPEMLSFDGPFEAQGNVSSTTIMNSWSNVGGEMPIQDIGISANSEASQDLSGEVAIPMPLDNPPLSSGAMPIQQSFSGMAASHGIRPTTDLQLKPSTLARQQMEIFNPSETKIETLLAHQTLLTKFNVLNTMPPGTELYKITLNTRAGIAEGNNIPINISVLNQFMFWRCDVELTFVAVQTKFHSMRLQALMAYGAPGLVLGSRNVSYSSNMSFSSDDMSTNYTHTEIIPYNAQTEFLRTYEGEGVTDPIQNYALGTFGVYVLNSLIAPDNVFSSVEVLVFLRFLNPKVAVPRPNSPFTWNDYLEYVRVPVYGFRARFGTDEGRQTIFLNLVSGGQPYTLMTQLEWTGGVVPAEGTYVLQVPKEFTFRFVFSSGGFESITLTRLVESVTIIDSNFYFNTEGVSLPSYTISTGNSFVVTGDFTFIVTPMRRTISYESFEAQGPGDAVTIEEVNPTATGENTEMAETIVMTKEETQHRPNIPCKNEIGQKFEFTITDIHEIGRRYIRVIPISNVDLDQFAVLTRNVSLDVTMNNLNIPVQPQNMWRGLFAAWAGGVKFRIYRNSEGFLPQVMFVPYYNKDVTVPGLPIIDAMQDFDFVAYGSSYTSSSSITGPLAREVLYPISETNFIDVSAPFQSHYNFCYNSKTQDIAPISSGTLVLSYGNDGIPIIYTAFADDLRLGIYRPPKTTTFNLTVFGNGIGGFM